VSVDPARGDDLSLLITQRVQRLQHRDRLLKQVCCLAARQGFGVLTRNDFDYMVSETIERRDGVWKRHGNPQLLVY
jgi:hypothetical protein